MSTRIVAKVIKASKLLNSATYILKRNRFREFGVPPGGRLPVVRLEPRVDCTSCKCQPYVSSSVAELETYSNTGLPKIIAAFKPTAAVTDLSDYVTVEQYLQVVSKATQGKYPRSANKARRAGYTVLKINHGSYGASLVDILKSKTVRSWGVVYEAIADVPNQAVDRPGPFVAPACPEHWRVDWALFPKGDNVPAKAVATLQRSGNFVIFDRMMGHADVLAAGGMKLLQFEIMAQLFDQNVPMTAGLRYVLHGGIEHGSTGMADWRRYMQQRPAALTFERLTNGGLPPDFDAKVYLDLNPDVRFANMNARTHFIWHGWLEGRRYKRGATDV